MQRAGHAAYTTALTEYPGARRWLIVCGSGNNAGDGYVIARLAWQNGLSVSLIALTDPETLSGDAALAYSDYVKVGGQTVIWQPGKTSLPADCDLVVDALLGTGLTRALTDDYRHVVEELNSLATPVLAVDAPTGLNSLSGEVMGAAVRAAITVSFVGLKQGFFLGAGPDHAGLIVFDDLSIPEAELAAVPVAMQVFDQSSAAEQLPRRSRGAHKSTHGHVLVIGGNAGMGGAVRLAGEAALRSGAGLVSVATRAENVPALTSGRPELMCHALDADAKLNLLLGRASVVAIGPGLGTDDWAENLWQQVLEQDKPLVVDADALNLLARKPCRRDNWVLTPHPGEAGRLLGISTAEVQADRLAALAQLKSRYGGVVVLKGHGSLVSASQVPWLIRAGNPGMGTAGMGDVLTGVTAGLLAQAISSSAASSVDTLSRLAATAVWGHAHAADQAAQAGERGLIATDVLKRLRAALNPDVALKS